MTLLHATLLDDRRYSVNTFHLVSILEVDGHAVMQVAGELVEVQETWGDLVSQYARIESAQTFEGIPLTTDSDDDDDDGVESLDLSETTFTRLQSVKDDQPDS